MWMKRPPAAAGPTCSAIKANKSDQRHAGAHPESLTSAWKCLTRTASSESFLSTYNFFFHRIRDLYISILLRSLKAKSEQIKAGKRASANGNMETEPAWPGEGLHVGHRIGRGPRCLLGGVLERLVSLLLLHGRRRRSPLPHVYKASIRWRERESGWGQGEGRLADAGRATDGATWSWPGCGRLSPGVEERSERMRGSQSTTTAPHSLSRWKVGEKNERLQLHSRKVGRRSTVVPLGSSLFR